MTYFISGHRDITEEEFDEFYKPAILDAINESEDEWDDCEFIVGDCRGCDEMAAKFIAEHIKQTIEDTMDITNIPCSLTIYHMFSEPRFRVGVQGEDRGWYLDCCECSDHKEDSDELYELEECPEIFYRGGFESDTDRDSAMTKASDRDIAFLRSKSKWDSGTAENLLRRQTMTFINPRKDGSE